MAKETEQAPENEVVGNPPGATIQAADERAGGPVEAESGEITPQQAGDNAGLPPREAPAAVAKRAAQARPAQQRVDYEVEADHTEKEAKADEKVRIHMAVPIPRMVHGGKWYAFQKDKVYVVPKSLKAALMKRPGLLKPTL